MYDKKNIKLEISSRFIEASIDIIERYKISSDSAFCKTITLNNVSYTDIKTGKLQIGIHYISILLVVYPEVNGEYILTGKGSLLKESPIRTLNKDLIDKVSELSAENALLKDELKKLKSKKNASPSDSKTTTQTTLEPKLK